MIITIDVNFDEDNLKTLPIASSIFSSYDICYFFLKQEASILVHDNHSNALAFNNLLDNIIGTPFSLLIF